MATVLEIITNGRLSVPISSNYQSKKSLFGREISPQYLPELIAMVTDALEWMNDGDNYTDAEETEVANYLVWLSGRFGLQAASISGSGGSVSPIVPGSSSPARIDFIVSASSYIPAGATSAALSQFINREIDFIRGGISQSTVTTEPSYIVWNRTTGNLTISPALAEGELISIIPS